MKKHHSWTGFASPEEIAARGEHSTNRSPYATVEELEARGIKFLKPLDQRARRELRKRLEPELPSLIEDIKQQVLFWKKEDLLEELIQFNKYCSSIGLDGFDAGKVFEEIANEFAQLRDVGGRAN